MTTHDIGRVLGRVVGGLFQPAWVVADVATAEPRRVQITAT